MSENNDVNKDENLNLDNNLRPGRIDEFIGQQKHKKNLKTFILGARQRNEALDHVVFHGPPGLGKTTLSNIIAAEMGVDIKQTSGPVLDKKGDLTAIKMMWNYIDGMPAQYIENKTTIKNDEPDISKLSDKELDKLIELQDKIIL